jgi:hypothetical protein
VLGDTRPGLLPYALGAGGRLGRGPLRRRAPVGGLAGARDRLRALPHRLIGAVLRVARGQLRLGGRGLGGGDPRDRTLLDRVELLPHGGQPLPQGVEMRRQLVAQPAQHLHGHLDPGRLERPPPPRGLVGVRLTAVAPRLPALQPAHPVHRRRGQRVAAPVERAHPRLVLADFQGLRHARDASTIAYETVEPQSRNA